MSSKYQVTLPMEIVRALGIHGGDKLIIELIEDRIIIIPKPSSFTDYFMGSLKGVYGSTPEEIDRYIAEVRHGWDVDTLRDATATDEKLRAVYDALPRSPHQGMSLTEICERSGVPDADSYLSRLEKEFRAVKRLAHPKYKAMPWYRRTV